MSEIFRKNAGIIIFNANKKVLLCERIDIENSWQFPQGGIENGETPSQAALRELQEETSVTNVKLIKTLDFGAKYRFPPEVIKSMQARGYNNVGQEMFWSLGYFLGNDSDINLQTQTPEFKQFKWGTLEEAYNLIIDFKKPAYKIALDEFSALIKNYKY